MELKAEKKMITGKAWNTKIKPYVSTFPNSPKSIFVPSPVYSKTFIKKFPSISKTRFTKFILRTPTAIIIWINKPNPTPLHLIALRLLLNKYAIRISTNIPSRPLINDSIESYEKAISLDLKSYKLLNDVALLYKKNKNFDKSINYLLKAIQINPNYEISY